MTGLFSEESTIDVSNKPTSKDDLNYNKEKNIHTIAQLVDCDGFELPRNIRLYNNGLLELAMPIISILLSIPRQDKPFNLRSFRMQLLDLLRDFKSSSISYDYHPSVVEKATYVLCVALDEAITHTSWGKDGGWVNHSLLSSMFTQRNGGEIFFVLLDKACQQPKLLIDFIELVYILLLLGFKGKYSDTDQNELYEIKSYVFSLIEHYYQDPKVIMPDEDKPKESSKPFIGFKYRYLVYYLMFFFLIVSVGIQIKYTLSHQPVSVVLEGASKGISQLVNGAIANEVEKKVEPRVSKDIHNTQKKQNEFEQIEEELINN